MVSAPVASFSVHAASSFALSVTASVARATSPFFTLMAVAALPSPRRPTLAPYETRTTLARIADVLADDGRVTLRNLMVPRAVAAETRALVLDAEGGAALHDRDRSFVYRSFQPYRRTPRAQS